jgi:hypothetical protein
MAEARSVSIDVTRVEWFDSFFKRVAGWSPQEVFDALGALDIRIDDDSLSADLELAMSGWAYWAFYIKGYLEYVEAGNVTPDNIYVRYLMAHFGPNRFDPGLSDVLVNDQVAAARVWLRFRDFDAIASATTDDGTTPVDPVILLVDDSNSDHAKVVYDGTTGERLPPALIDGYHRIFVARLFGLRSLAAVLTDEGLPEYPEVTI